VNAVAGAGGARCPVGAAPLVAPWAMQQQQLV